jgi:Fe/S biogenesis protein NfuA
MIVNVTAAARRAVLDLRANEPDPERLALRIDITGVGEGGREFAYELQFESIDAAGEGDDVTEVEGLPVFIPAASSADLDGATLDHTDADGLVIRNPHRPRPPAAAGPVVLEGSVEQKLTTLLDEEINPSLAMHGGFAALDRLEGDVAYITMGGGCQGCGLAKVTLSDGIKATIVERIPEIREVVDLTDHASGANPFFDPVA